MMPSGSNMTRVLVTTGFASVSTIAWVAACSTKLGSRFCGLETNQGLPSGWGVIAFATLTFTLISSVGVYMRWTVEDRASPSRESASHDSQYYSSHC